MPDRLGTPKIRDCAVLLQIQDNHGESPALGIGGFGHGNRLRYQPPGWEPRANHIGTGAADLLDDRPGGNRH
jgi:hypothetical protein